MDVVLPSVLVSLDRAQPCMLPLLSRGSQGKQKCFCEQIKMVPLLLLLKRGFVQFSWSDMRHNMTEEIALMAMW